MAALSKTLLPGDPAPWFVQKSSLNPRYRFDTAGGRVLVRCVLGSAVEEHALAALKAVGERGDLFDDTRACFFGVSMDPADEAGRLQARMPGYRHFWDMDGTIGKLYGALPPGFREGAGAAQLSRRWVVLDQDLRVIANVPFAADRSDIALVLALVERHSVPEGEPGPDRPVPVLLLERVLEPELCGQLLAYRASREAFSSGFMVEENGQTVLKSDAGHKRRKDCVLEDERLKEQIRLRIIRRVVPEIAKAFQYHVTRIERYLIGHYSAADQGFFRAHRDNTTKGTAHRRFALTMALNDDYEGGELNFPEFGRHWWKPPAGGAVVFSCSLLHQVRPVTRGERYVFVPFLYDDAAAKLREKNRKFLNL